MANSLEGFVVARFVQGMGGAMMTPVGRLLLVRAVPKSDLVSAMAWFTIPALVGPLVGPPVGGAIATYADWRWIFLINLPIGIAGILLATKFLPKVDRVRGVAFDAVGFVLSGMACAGIVFGCSVVSLPALPPQIGVAMAIMGLVCGLLFVRHARRVEEPVLKLSLFRIETLRAAIVGGTFFRVGSGAVPFLLPLMLQLGFGYTPLQSGLVTCVSIGGAMGMKFLAKPILKRFGFRTTLIATAILGGGLMGAIGLYRPDSPIAVVLLLLLIGGFFRSLFFTSINALAFADVPKKLTGDATAMMAAIQQVSVAMGVALAGGILEAGMALSGRTTSSLADFSTAFFAIGVITTSAAFVFLWMGREAGDEVAGRRVPAE